MSKQATAAADAAPARSYVLARAAEPQWVKGRRDFLQYRELGATEASAGNMRAQLTSARQGLSRPTGWHYHVCDTQLVYMLSGWVELQFAEGPVRIEAGDCISIPGGLPHNETATSDDFELIEVSIPAEMGTEVCPPPPGCEA